MIFRRALSSLAFLAFAGTAAAGGSVVAKRAALSTASPLATRAGLAVLQRGGNAADAAVAVAFALAVVHPQAGNLGGGGFCLYYDATTRAVWALDFRETSPAGAIRTIFDSAGAEARRTGGLASGVPATVSGLGELHRKFGSAKWSGLLEPAIALAAEGYRVDEELRQGLETAARERGIGSIKPTADLFFEGGRVRERVTPSDLGATLRLLASNGPRDFYEGTIAKRLVEASRATGGLLTARDLRGYEPVWRAPIRIEYGGLEIHAPPVPSAGGIVLAESLAILSGDDLRALGHQSVPALHLILEASRRAHLDRYRYLGDPASIRVPFRELLSKDRAERWRRTIEPGRVVVNSALMPGEDVSPTGEHTTHFTIADAEGNVVALTTSLGDDFGNGVVLPGLGFFMNNAMNDFGDPSGPNALDPGKRPISSLTPLIVLKDGKPYLAMGSRGGAAIATTMLQLLLDVAVYRHAITDAIAAPRFHHGGIPEEALYERGRAPQPTIDGLNALGHPVRGLPSIGDVHAVLFEKDGMIAIADPRRGGAAGGL